MREMHNSSKEFMRNELGVKPEKEEDVEEEEDSFEYSSDVEGDEDEDEDEDVSDDDYDPLGMPMDRRLAFLRRQQAMGIDPLAVDFTINALPDFGGMREDDSDDDETPLVMLVGSVGEDPRRGRGER